MGNSSAMGVCRGAISCRKRGVSSCDIGADIRLTRETAAGVGAASVIAGRRGAGENRTLRAAHLNGGIEDGKPTRMKYRAKACEKCSRNGDSRRQRDPSSSARVVRYPRGKPKIWPKSTIRAAWLFAGSFGDASKCSPAIRPLRISSHLELLNPGLEIRNSARV